MTQNQLGVICGTLTRYGGVQCVPGNDPNARKGFSKVKTRRYSPVKSGNRDTRLIVLVCLWMNENPSGNCLEYAKLHPWGSMVLVPSILKKKDGIKFYHLSKDGGHRSKNDKVMVSQSIAIVIQLCIIKK